MNRAGRLAAFALLALALQPGYSQGASVPAGLAATGADAAFQVATIKPSDPNKTGWMLGTKGNHFFAENVTVTDLITFAYEVHARQIVGGPPWIATARFDVEGVPEKAGRPAREQLQAMLRGLLQQRFHLELQPEQRELAIYKLTVANSGPKFSKSADVEGEHPGYNFPRMTPHVEMTVMHMTMANFASALQRNVTDRPVLDDTGLTGRYGFTLTWTPDDSQFTQLRANGGPAPRTSGEPNAPPGLFTAIQEQLGLKLEPVKAPVGVLAVVRVEQPSAN